MVGYRAFANCTAVLPDPSPSGFRPRIGVRDRLSPERRGGRRGPIPGRSPGHAFIGIAHAGWCRHSQGMKSRSCGLVQRIDTVGSPTPRPDPCVGQAHALQDSGCRRNDGSRPFP